MSPALLATGKPVETSAYFLERSERWKDEKPYLLDYLPAPPAVKTNAAIEQQNIDIEDIRGRENEFSFQKNGFCIVPIDCNMDPLDFDDDDHIKELYLPEIGESVKKALCATRVQIYDYTVRKRESNFPYSTGGHYSHKQPASVAHIDTTPACMAQMQSVMNRENTDRLGDLHYQSVNIWKPLRGPLRDWPIALCDPTTITVKDLQARDTVKRDSFIETYQLHHRSGQKWYYISDQSPEEAWVFLQADSSPHGMLGVPHASFLNPESSDTDVPRESIEVRCLAYYE